MRLNAFFVTDKNLTHVFPYLCFQTLPSVYTASLYLPAGITGLEIHGGITVR